MRRAAASAALISLLAATPACTMTRSTSNTVMAVGAGIAAGGVLVTRDAVENDFNDGFDDGEDRGTDWGGVGLLMMVAGLALVAGGASADEPWHEPRSPVEARPGPPLDTTVVGADDLPAVPTTDEVVRLAQQARAAVHRHECDAAWRTLAMIDQRDRDYATLLAAGPVMQPCPRAY